MKTYEEYKNSGIKWLGEVPSHWEEFKFKFAGTYTKGRLPKDTNVDSVGSPIIGASEMLGKTTRTYTEDKNVPKCESEDILILWDGANAGITSSKLVGVVSSTAVRYRLAKSGVYSSYVSYLIKHYERYFRAKVNGTTIPHMNSTFIDDCPMLVPPLSEQTAIADYLDAKTSEIDAMVEKAEKKIALFEELKKSVITRAVTKGLDPNAKLKDSGVKWIGKIPEGWEVSRLKFCTSKVGSGSTPKGGAEVYTEEGVKFLRSQNIYFEGLHLDDVAHITNEVHESMKGTKVLPGDVLLNITGGSIGRCFYVDDKLGEANVNQHVSIVRPHKYDTKYLKYYLQSDYGQSQVRLLQTGGNREGLTAVALKEFQIFALPLSEQRSIATYLDAKCAAIDASIAKARKKIDYLNELKQSLITEVVTGKRKVC